MKNQKNNRNDDRNLLNEVIGKRINELIIKNNDSQQTLAENLGISQGSLSNYINGKRDIPAFVIDGIAEAYGVSTDYIFGYPEDSNSESNLLVRELRLNGFSQSGIDGLLETSGTVNFINFFTSHPKFKSLMSYIDSRYTFRELFGRSYRSFLITQCINKIVYDYLGTMCEDPIEHSLTQLPTNELQCIESDVDNSINVIRTQWDAYYQIINSDDDISDPEDIESFMQSYQHALETIYPDNLASFELQKIKARVSDILEKRK